MNLYEYEGKKIFSASGIKIPKGTTVKHAGEATKAYDELGCTEVVVKAQVLSGKRGKNNGIFFCASGVEAENACKTLLNTQIRSQHVPSIRIEEKLDIAAEHYLSITYDTIARQPVLVYSSHGGVDIEDVDGDRIHTFVLDIREHHIPESVIQQLQQLLGEPPENNPGMQEELISCAQKLWVCFLDHDMRLAEINPLVYTAESEWIAADAKIAIDDDAFYRHKEWEELEPRTMMGRPPTEREIAVQKIDSGEGYYRGTAGKYIEMDGDIATLFIGGGASIANMDVMDEYGLRPANYTEYSGNPPREKVYELTKIVLSKPGLKGLWIVGVVSNFTNVKETFAGTVDALEEIKPAYPIVIRRDGPFGEEGRQLMVECATRNGFDITVFGKDTSMGETARVLAEKVHTYLRDN